MRASRPAAVRVDDWRAPRMPAPLRALNALPAETAERWIPLDLETLLERARRHTGLHDFGDPGFREPLQRIVHDLASDPHLTPAGRITARTVLGQLLQARLRVTDHLARHPDVLEQKVAAPIVIVGLPRTGTTHLHCLLAQVPALRSLPLWESIEPLPREPGPLGRLLGSRFGDGRRLRAALRLRALDQLAPLLRRMHEMEVDLPHEELQLTALDFRSFYFEGSFRLPDYVRWYAKADNTGAYRTLRRMLQLLQALRGGSRWVLKSPQHLDQLPALHAAFPDAKIVRTHRDPTRAVLSLASMLVYARRVCYRGLDPTEEGRIWVDRLEGMLRSALEEGDRLPPESCMDLRFDAFVADPVAAVGRVLDFAGLPFDPEARERVAAFARRHAAERTRFDYRFEDLGLDRAALAERFRFYSERFALGASDGEA